MTPGVGSRDDARGRKRLPVLASALGWISLAALILTGLLVNRMNAWGRSSSRLDAAVQAPAKPLVSIPDGHSAVLDFSGRDVRTPVRPKRTVALTFEDGPDPLWTPKVLDVLKRHNAKATFFVVGAAVNQHTDTVRAALADGHDVGNHTYSHTALGDSGAWRRRVELSLTNVALTRAGRTTRIMRPPNSTLAARLTADELKAAESSGYLVVLTDAVAPDRTDSSVEEIVNAVLPNGDDGAIITFHDGGRNQQRTVDALDKLLTTLAARDFQFVTVSQYAGLADGAVLAQPTVTQRVGAFAVTVVALLSGYIGVLALIAALALVVVSLVRAIVLIRLSRRSMMHEQQRRTLPATADLPTLTVLLRATGDDQQFEQTLHSLQTSNYPRFDVIVMDDGSISRVDGRMKNVADSVVIPYRGNAATALNTALEFATGRIVVMVEPGTLLEAGTLRALAAPLLSPTVGAVAGTVRVVHPGGLVGRIQHLDAALANAELPMFTEAGSVLAVPLAVGAYRRQALLDVGGVPTDTEAWNSDLTLALQRAGWKVDLAADARAWTDGPQTWRTVWCDHERSARAMYESLAKHRSRVQIKSDRPSLGRFVFRFGFASLLTSALAPLAGLFLVLTLLHGRFWTALGVWGALTAIAVVVAGFAFRLDGERYRNLWIVPVRQVVQQLAMASALVASARRRIGSRRRSRSATGTAVFVSQSLAAPIVEGSERAEAQPAGHA